MFSQSILYDASEKSLILNQGKFNEDLISQNIPHFKISENYGVYMKLELKNHTYEVSTKLTAGNSRIRN